jgi:hypothetical protein
MAVKQCQPKVLKVKPPRDPYALLEAFLFEDWAALTEERATRGMALRITIEF